MDDLIRKRELTKLRTQAYRARKNARFIRKVEAQAKCDCCGEYFETPYTRYVVQDHDHLTNELRGVICQTCNKRVGMVEAGTPFSRGGTRIYRSYIDRWAELNR